MAHSHGDTRAVHAIKFTKRTNLVRVFSVAFDRRNPELVDPFWEELQKRMKPYASRYGRFVRIARPGMYDWYIILTSAWPERILDQLLAESATVLGAKMYIEPGISLAEMDPDLRNFLFEVNTARRRPNN